MDPFEEFEFKPLTDGLGFHKKKVDLGDEVKSASLAQSVMGKSLPPATDRLMGIKEEKKTRPSTGMELVQPLPTKGSKTPNPISQRSDVIDELVKSFKQPKIEFNEKAILSAQNQVELKPTAWSLFPFVIDAMMVLAISLFCLIIALSTTRIDFVKSLMSPNTDPLFFVAMVGILMAMGMVYMVITRGFLGGTLGEMVFDMQAGAEMDQQHPLYPLRVIGRSLLVFGTGLVTLPIISIILRSDLAGKWTGTTLVSRN